MMDISEEFSQFLKTNSRFKFQLYEYIYSTKYIGQVRLSLLNFLSQLKLSSLGADPWEQRRIKLKKLLHPISAWQSIDWERKDYKETVPFSTKGLIRANSGIFINPEFAKESLWYRETSGTTGPPLKIWYSPLFSVEMQYGGVEKLMSVAGITLASFDANDINILAIVDNQYVVESVIKSPDQVNGLSLRITFNERNPESIGKLYNDINLYRPQVITLKPNVLDAITREENNSQIKVPSELLVIFCSGANLEDGVRYRAEKIFGVSVINGYGLTEVGLLASECSFQNGLHIYEHEAIFEVLGRDGMLSETGEGELVITSVRNEAMPLARYRTGDMVELSDKPCACGLPTRRLTKISGRVYRNFILSDGSILSPTRINRIFDEFPIREFRLSQMTKSLFNLEVETDDNVSDQDSMLEKISSHVGTIIGDSASLKTRSVVFSNNGKFERYRFLE